MTAKLNVESLPLRRSERLVTEEYFELKTKIHSRLLDLLDLSLIDTLERNALRGEIKRVIGRGFHLYLWIDQKGKIYG